MADLAGIRSRFTALAAILDERSRRLLAAAVKGGGKLDHRGGAKLDRLWAEWQFFPAF